MTEIEEWIEGASKSRDLDVRRLDDLEAREIARSAKQKFVLGEPRAWWLSLRLPSRVVSSEGAVPSKMLPMAVDRLLFLPETETEELPVYEVSRTDIDQLIGECPFFEYYLIDRALSWLVIESDHNEFVICVDPAAGIASPVGD